MPLHRVAGYTLVLLFTSGSFFAADPPPPAALLDQAERIHAADKPASRRLLDAVERDAAAQRDPLLVARMELLECNWRDTQKRRRGGGGVRASRRRAQRVRRSEMPRGAPGAARVDAARRDVVTPARRVRRRTERRAERALTRENALRNTALREAARNGKLQIVVIALTALPAIALAILFWRTRTMALTDELTRLPNRRRVLAADDSALGAAKQSARGAAVIVIDIDRFKWINDT